MRHLRRAAKSRRRTFTLQVYDRPSEPLSAPARRNSDHVYDALDGHPLECPGCGREPLVTNSRVQDDNRPITSVRNNGPPVLVGVAKYMSITTMEATCEVCSMTLTYMLDNTGQPHLTEQIQEMVAKNIEVDGLLVGDGTVHVAHSKKNPFEGF